MTGNQYALGFGDGLLCGGTLVIGVILIMGAAIGLRVWVSGKGWK